MVEPIELGGLTIEALQLSLDTYRWITQAPSVKHVPEKGIVNVGDLVRREADNLGKLPAATAGRIAEVEHRLAVAGLRLADPVAGPCVAAPAGNEWVRLPYPTSKSSWVFRNELVEVDLYRLIGPPASAFAYVLGVHLVVGLRELTAARVLTEIHWAARNMDGHDVLRRLNTALEDLGLPPVR